LFEEKRHSRREALVADIPNPRCLDWPSARPGFATNNHPVDAIQWQIRDLPNERLDRKEADLSMCLP
jgi:hypothetical protein